MYKKKVFLSLILIAFFAIPQFSEAAVIVKPNNNLGLVGYWQFENGSGSVATDSSGQGNVGTLTNMEDGDWVEGKVNGGLDFDGSDEYVDVGSGFEDIFYQAADFSFGVWFKHDVVSEDYIASIMRSSGSDKFGPQWFIDGSGDNISELCFRIDDSTQGNYTLCSDTNVDDGEWHYLVTTYENEAMEIYLDGTLVISGSNTRDTSATPGNEFVIGVRHYDSTYVNYFDGQIDDVRIYNRALSASEITKLYNTKAPSKQSTTRTSGDSLETGLVSHWTFDGGDISGTTITDIAGGYDGTATGAPTGTIGKIGQGYSFDGSSRITGSTDSAQTPSVGSISLWVKMDDLSDIEHYVSKLDSGAKNGLVLYYHTSNKLSFQAGNGSTWPVINIPSGVDPDVGEWNHIVATWDASNAYLYKDTAQIGTDGGATITPNSADALYIGDDTNNPGTRYLEGDIDDVRIYNKVLSQKEIQRLYNMGAGTKVAAVSLSADAPYKDETPSSFMAATGGTITTDGDYKVHTFNSGGTFDVTSGSGDAEVLVVAGGGSGGRGRQYGAGGGGGAGGLVSSSTYSITGDVSVTVGSGGAGNTGAGNNGGDSIFGTITAVGGGAGGGVNSPGDGQDGGSGAGGAGSGSSENTGAGDAVSGQGNSGGAGFISPTPVRQRNGGGGGGKGASGQAASVADGGDGGDGEAYSISGSSVTYGGGGGGGAMSTAFGTYGNGGAGGGGGGSKGSDACVDGSDGLGSGGGGHGGIDNWPAAGTNYAGCNGGSGVVIIRYQFQ